MSTLNDAASEGLVYPSSSIPFLLLTDTPVSYVDNAGKVIAVNATEDGLEFADSATSASISDTAYDATTWNGDTTHAPSKNAIRDKLESLSISGTPGGSTTELQRNNAGAFGGITGATRNGTTVTLTDATLVTPILGQPQSGDLSNCTGIPTNLSDIAVDDNYITRKKLNYVWTDIATVTTSGTATLVPANAYYGTVAANTTITFSPTMSAADAPTICALQFTTQPWTLTYPTAIRNDANGSSTSVSVTANKYVIIEFFKTGAGNIRMIDNIESLTSSGVSDTAYGSSWDGVTTVAGSKNAIYDQIHKIDTADDGTIVNAGTGFRIAGAAGSGKILVGNGTNYVPSTPTFPNSSATSGKIIKSDGTNWAASTETYAAPGTSGNIMTSDGTNWTSAALTRIRTITFVFDGQGVALTTGNTGIPYTIPIGGTITGWSISADGSSPTGTLKVWKQANSTAIPTISDVINTSGVALSSGNHVRSTTVSDFTSTTVTTGDKFIAALTAVATATKLIFELEVTT